MDRQMLPERDIDELANWEPERNTEVTKTVTLPSVSPAKRQATVPNKTSDEPLVPSSR